MEDLQNCNQLRKYVMHTKATKNKKALKMPPSGHSESIAKKCEQRKHPTQATSATMTAARKALLSLERGDSDESTILSDGELYIDESNGTEKHIYLDRSVDKTIKENAAKNNLTTSNVKSILRSLITNDLVKTMLKNTLESSAAKQDGIIYEPKLTRSKMKEVLEKGSGAQVWPVSPAKLGRSSSSGPSILDVDFNEEEDEEDDEYKPDKDSEDFETDDESIISSQTSDVGSPVCSTPHRPTTPLSALDTGCCRTPVSASCSQVHCGSMGPPSSLPAKPSVRHALHFTSDVQISETTQEPNKDVIAKRTRSKHPLTATSLYDIEEAFVAPDITPDMYDTNCDDSDWQEFLRGLHKYPAGDVDVQNESTEAADDEQNDPEFNYLAEAETEELEKDDFRFDRPFRISRKELNELMDELDELFNDEDRSLIGLRTNLATAQENAVVLASKKICEARENAASVQLENISITEDQGLQIQEQMRKHVQLTCQMFVLARGSHEHQEVAELCAGLLGELDFFRSVSPAGDKSFYHVCNLSPAVSITKQDSGWQATRQDLEEKQAGSEAVGLHMQPKQSALPKACTRSRGRFSRPLLSIQTEILWNSPVFMYPELLPRTALLPKNLPDSYNKVFFTKSEDMLLAMGLDEFKSMKKPYSYIQQLMMPCKSVRQIMVRVKNLTGSRRSICNVVWHYKQTGRLPDLPQRQVERFSPSMFRAPRDQCLSLLPDWCKAHHQDLKREQNRKWAAEQMKMFSANSSLASASQGHGSRKRKRQENQTCCSTSGSSSEDELDTCVTGVKDQHVRCRQVLLRRHKSRKIFRGPDLCTPTPVTVLPSSQGTPGVIVTSMGVFVPIHLASPALLQSAFAPAHTPASSSTQQPCLTTAQIFSLDAEHSQEVCGTTRDSQTMSVSDEICENHGQTFSLKSSTADSCRSNVAFSTDMDVCYTSCRDNRIGRQETSVIMHDDSLGSNNHSADSNVSSKSQIAAGHVAGNCQTPEGHATGNSGTAEDCATSNSGTGDGDVGHICSTAEGRAAGSCQRVEDHAAGGCVRKSFERKQTTNQNNGERKRQECVIQSSAVTSGWDSDEESVRVGGTSPPREHDGQDLAARTVSSPRRRDTSGARDWCAEPDAMEPDSTSSLTDVDQAASETQGAASGLGTELQGKSWADTLVHHGCEASITADIVQMAWDSLYCCSPKQLLSSLCCHQQKTIDFSLVKEWQGHSLGPPMTTVCAVTSQDVTKQTQKDNGTSGTPAGADHCETPDDGHVAERDHTGPTPCADFLQSTTTIVQEMHDSCALLPTPSFSRHEGAMTDSVSEKQTVAVPVLKPAVVPHVSWSCLSSVCNASARDLVTQQLCVGEDTSAKDEGFGTDQQHCRLAVSRNTTTLETSYDPQAAFRSTSILDASCDSSLGTSHMSYMYDNAYATHGILREESSGTGSQTVITEESQLECLAQKASTQNRAIVVPDTSETRQETDDTSETRQETDDTSETRQETDDTSETRQETDDTSETRQETDDTGESRHGTGNTDESRHEADDTGESRHETDDTGESRHETDDTGESRHRADDTGGSRAGPGDTVREQLHMQILNERSPSKHRTSSVAAQSVRSGMESVVYAPHVFRVSSVGREHHHLGSSLTASSAAPAICSSSMLQGLSSAPKVHQMPNQTKSSKSLCAIAPKPGVYFVKCPQFNPASATSSGRASKKEVSPKKRQLQRQVRAILPRGYTYEMKITSPTKAAAKSLKRKATLICQRTSPAKPILPKSPAMAQSTQSLSISPTTGEAVRWTRRGIHRASAKLKQKTPHRKNVRKVMAAGKACGEERGHGDSDGTASDVEEGAALSQEDSQNEEDPEDPECSDDSYVTQLMAASTTIGFDPRKRLRLDKDCGNQGALSKAEMRKEQKLAILAPDIMEADPRRDVRDTALAQAYLNKLKVTLQQDPHTYSQLLQLLVHFEKDSASPLQVYREVCVLLRDYPQLLEEFATFLSPGQALLTDCLPTLRHFSDARTFLRRLELHFEKSQAQFQRILRAISRWNSKCGSPAELKQALLPLLRSVPQYILDDLSRFLPEDHPPDSHADDFEDVTLDDSDASSADEFEEVELVEENDPYRTKRCPCSCHTDFPTARRWKRVGHCLRCSLKVSNGRLYFQPSNATSRRPASVTFHDPVTQPAPHDPPPPFLFRQQHRKGVERGEGKAVFMEDDSKVGMSCTEEESAEEKSGKQDSTFLEDMHVAMETEPVCTWPKASHLSSGDASGDAAKPDLPQISRAVPIGACVSEGEAISRVSGHLPSLLWPPSALLASNNGTMSFAGPDNTVIMVNPAVPTLGDRMPTRQDSRCLTVTEEQRCLAPDHAASCTTERTFYSVVPPVTAVTRLSSTSAAAPHEDFADLQTTVESAASHWIAPLSHASVSIETGVNLNSDLSHLLTEGALDEQHENFTQSNLSLPEDSNTSSDLLAKAMKFAHIRRVDSTHSDTNTVPDDQQTAASAFPRPSQSRVMQHEAVDTLCRSSETAWSRETDKLILETVREQGPSPRAYEWIAKQLGICTLQQVSQRFEHLMQLFSDYQDTDEEDLQAPPVSHSQ